jgi:putative radical SAM enzyme (TIGR03279 family)
VKAVTDSYPVIAGVEQGSNAASAGVLPGDKVVSVNGVVPRDILEWQKLVDSDEVELMLLRGNESIDVLVHNVAGSPFGVSISSAVFDRIHTCDNHCEFCFIYQLPKGMRRSLYLKDDDYRLSFLFGNFTTLTRFTEADLERVLEERLSPIYVSIHANSPHLRSEMLRNDRGGFSLRWMKILAQNDIQVRAQIVLCPGVNDKDHLSETLAGLLEECPELESIAIVPLGLSRFNTESRMRVQSKDEAVETIATVEKWQSRYRSLLGRDVIHLADEFYLVAEIDLPEAEHYGEYPMLEDGVGLARSFMNSFTGIGPDHSGRSDGFFSSVDSPTDYVRLVNPASDTGLRTQSVASVTLRVREKKATKPLAVITGSYGAVILSSVLEAEGFADVDVVEVKNEYFGGNTGVAGLLTYEDICAVLRRRSDNRRYLVPDVCLNDGVFLDGGTFEALSSEFDVEVIATSGAILRKRLEAAKEELAHV